MIQLTGDRSIPVLTPKQQLLNVGLVQLHGFEAFIGRISISKNQPVNKCEVAY